MTSPQLDLHINQFFAFAALTKADRYDDVRPAFTYRTADLLLSVFGEAFDALEQAADQEYSPHLLRFAQVFERFSAIDIPGVDRRSAARTSAAFYWLAGYAANALVLARSPIGTGGVLAERRSVVRLDKLSDVLSATLARRVFATPAPNSDVASHLRRYLQTGSRASLSNAHRLIKDATETAFGNGQSSEYAAGVLLDAVLRRLDRVSLWGSIAGHTSAPVSAWRKYARAQTELATPLIDLWPSQRRAIAKGLLDDESSLVLRMPTSAGKTKLTELAFVNDLATHPGRCLYLAPFRALVSDVEASLAPTLTKLGYPVASLYGSSDANELEVDWAERARVVIATPEKIGTVTRLSGGSLADYDTIVVDEGHLLGSPSRGVAFELQLANVRAAVTERRAAGRRPPRILFLSAVLPNAGHIARWLTGDEDALAESDWHPTAMRFGILTWGNNRFARIDYLPAPNGEAGSAYFVPRLLETDTWAERHSTTGRLRTYKFPERRKKASVAAAFAFQAVRSGSVLIYAQKPAWVNSIAECIVDRREHSRPIETGLISDTNRAALVQLVSFVESRLGAESLVLRALAQGIGVHHSGVPHSIRLILEDAFRDQTIRLLVATSTVAQGVNFPARTVIVHSLPRGEAPIRDFWNLAGRAGRAMRETEGELIVLCSESSAPASMGQFLQQSAHRKLRISLQRENTEPVRSQILRFAQALVEAGGVSDATLDALLSSPRDYDTVDWSKPLAAIDTDLLERLTEDAEGADEGAIARLLPHLLATTQASLSETPEQDTGAVRTLLQQRARVVRQAAPTAAIRQRYARSGLTAADAVAIDANVEVLRSYLLIVQQFNYDTLGAVLQEACASRELVGMDLSSLTRIAMAWVTTGRYHDVWHAAPEAIPSIDEAIEYVEDVLCYELNWILNGLIRLMDGEPGAGAAARRAALPEWFRYLPQYLRYGVDSRDLLWVMTLGIHDRVYASHILAALSTDGVEPASEFRDFVQRFVDNAENLFAMTLRERWPSYFVRRLDEVVTRYRGLLAASALGA
jgi:superfamily II DNA/RNA helicase